VADQEWYSATKALALLEPFHGALTKAYIADKLRDGHMRSRAKKIWVSNDPTLNDAWRNRDNAVAKEDVEIERKLWKSSRYWPNDVSQWSWPEEKFVITRGEKPADRTIIVGLSLSATDIDALAIQKIDARYIKRRKKDEWELFWMTILQLSQDKSLNLGRFASQSDLLSEVQITMNPNLRDGDKRLLSDESLEPFIAMIWNRFIVPKR
jgi:hypothetical protein